MGLPILSLLQIRHHTIHHMWLRREEVNGLHIAVRRSSVGDDFNVGDAFIQDGILIQDIVEQFLAIRIQYQHFPIAPGDLSDRIQ